MDDFSNETHGPYTTRWSFKCYICGGDVSPLEEWKMVTVAQYDRRPMCSGCFQKFLESGNLKNYGPIFSMVDIGYDYLE